MTNEKPHNTPLLLYQNVKCSENKFVNKIFWKKEIDHQYKFYLASLRAEQDVALLIKEHTNLMDQIKSAEETNVNLRKEVRLLETELYLMYQRNAHDSAAIDGLHEADYAAEKIDHLESDIKHKIQIAEAEGRQEDVLSDVLKEEIDLLKKKDVEDKELISSLKPLEEKLKKTLDEEKLKNHQQGMKFKREFENLLQEFQKRQSELQTIAAEKSSAILWAMELFSSLVECQTESTQQISTENDTDSVGSSRATDLFEISSIPENISDQEDPEKDLQKLKECSEFVALKELLDSKNLVNIRVVLNCLKQFSEIVQNLADEYLFTFDVAVEIAFIKEYLQRLDLMRKKKDIVMNENCMEAAQKLDQLTLIYNSLMCEKMFLINLLEYFTSTFSEDFEVNCVKLRKMEECFIWTIQSVTSNIQDDY